jgi:hypothetical protein
MLQDRHNIITDDNIYIFLLLVHVVLNIRNPFHSGFADKFTQGHLNAVTDLGFRCRGAEHLLLLLDTRKT